MTHAHYFRLAAQYRHTHPAFALYLATKAARLLLGATGHP